MVSFLRVFLYSVVSLCLLLLVLSPFVWVVNAVFSPLILLLKIHLPFSVAVLPWFIVLFFSSGLVLYFLADYFIGFTYRSLLKELDEVGTSFRFWKDHQEITEKFGLKKTELYLQKGVFNAFALQSPSRKGIVLGQDLLDKFQSVASNDEEFREAIRGVLGHECSHLKSGDYFPTWIYLASQNVLTAFQVALLSVIQLLGSLLGVIPLAGPLFGRVFQFLQQGSAWVFTRTRDVVLPFLLKFLDSWLSRRMELRCDHQSSQVVGARANLLTQKFLTMFSGSTKTRLLDTHPESTTRVLRVFRLTRKELRPLLRLPSPGTAVGALLLVVAWFTYTWYSLEKIHLVPSEISPAIDLITRDLGASLTALWQGVFSFLSVPLNQLGTWLWSLIREASVGVWNGSAFLYAAIFGQGKGVLNDFFLFLASLLGVIIVLVTGWFGLRLILDLLVTYGIWEPVKVWMKGRLNRSEETPIDFLLEHSALRDSRLSAFRTLWNGALVTSAPENTTKKMKLFFKGLK